MPSFRVLETVTTLCDYEALFAKSLSAFGYSLVYFMKLSGRFLTGQPWQGKRPTAGETPVPPPEFGIIGRGSISDFSGRNSPKNVENVLSARKQLLWDKWKNRFCMRKSSLLCRRIPARPISYCRSDFISAIVFDQKLRLRSQIAYRECQRHG